MTDWLMSLSDDLNRREVTRNEFEQTVQRLLDHGILWNGENSIETELYAVASRIETHLEDFLGLMGFRLYHDKTYQYFKAYPPGASVPVLADEPDPEARGFRKRLKQDEVALALVLRVLYQQKTGEGAIDDDGEAPVSVEEISSAMVSTLNRSMPSTQSEYRNLLLEMRKLRLLRFESDADLFEGDGWMYIRPVIIAMVSQDILSNIARAHMPQPVENTDAD